MNYNWFLSFVNWPLALWRALASPLNGECSLSLLVNQFWESWIPFQVVDGEEINTSHWILIKVFYIQFEGTYIQVLIYLPILPFFLLHSPTLSCWWCTCWSGACTLLSIFDSQYWVYDVWLCTLCPYSM